jgi:glutamyl-Q tRNA(Asp) synthetase
VNGAKSSTATATTATAESPPERRYAGRFAPSPSGDLHLGSLYTAAASYLDARTHGGQWRVRVEDVDVPRVVPGSAAGILSTLQEFGFEWDGEVVYQSRRTHRYEAAIEMLRSRGLIFECSCSRTQLADEDRYPGHCRGAPRLSGTPTALRLRVEPGHIQFTDRIQGTFRQDVAAVSGDVVLRRRDRLIAYLLAVVVDDAAQGITHVVRGADLLDNTPRQIYLQRALGVVTPSYAHVPVLVEADGSKLAKSARSMRVDAATVVPQLWRVFTLLQLSPPPELRDASRDEAWRWALGRWRTASISPRLTQAISA